MKTCTVGSCTRVHLARGMCSSHYAAWHRREFGRRDATFRLTCLGCGEAWDCSRPEGKYCSTLCRSYAQHGPTYCPLPVRRKVPEPKAPPFTPVVRLCAWCGEGFEARRNNHTLCSVDCKIRAKRARRRGRAAGSPTSYTWTEVMRVFLLFGKSCAYCHEQIEGQPDPDHVVPLSRGGSNSITNILPSCRTCNSDKRDLLLCEWNQDRARRGLPLRTTNWPTQDPRIQHLTSTRAA